MQAEFGNRPYPFEDRGEQFLQDTLARLVAELRVFTGESGKLADVWARRVEARIVQRKTIEAFWPQWEQAIAAIDAGLYTFAVLGVLASVVGAYYYVRIVKIMYFDEPAEEFEAMSGPQKRGLGLAGLAGICFFAYPAPLVAMAATAAKALF